MTIPSAHGVSSRHGHHRAHRLVVEAIGGADPGAARASREALIASTAREAGRIVDGRSATGRNT